MPKLLGRSDMPGCRRLRLCFTRKGNRRHCWAPKTDLLCELQLCASQQGNLDIGLLLEVRGSAYTHTRNTTLVCLFVCVHVGSKSLGVLSQHASTPITWLPLSLSPHYGTLLVLFRGVSCHCLLHHMTLASPIAAN